MIQGTDSVDCDKEVCNKLRKECKKMDDQCLIYISKYLYFFIRVEDRLLFCGYLSFWHTIKLVSLRYFKEGEPEYVRMEMEKLYRNLETLLRSINIHIWEVQSFFFILVLFVDGMNTYFVSYYVCSHFFLDWWFFFYFSNLLVITWRFLCSSLIPIFWQTSSKAFKA